MSPVERALALERLTHELRAAPPAERFSQITTIKGWMLDFVRDDPARAADATRLRGEVAERLETMRIAGLYLERRLPPRAELEVWRVQSAVRAVTGREVGVDSVARRRAVREPRALPLPEPIAVPIPVEMANEPPRAPAPLRLVPNEPEPEEPDPPPVHERSLPEILANVADPARRNVFENP